MLQTSHYESPFGDILLAADDKGLAGLWFEGQRYYPKDLERLPDEANSPGFGAGGNEDPLPIFDDVREWLDIYFAGKDPGFVIPLHFIGTRFQIRVWGALCRIPYGKIATYGEIAGALAEGGVNRGMSARAVAEAAARNKISVIVPCHRVVGHDGRVSGYSAGIERRLFLMELEKTDMSGLFVPNRAR